ncbi:hypothetical protein LAZ67_4003355 [Cordylochernes scorpioides]|uniref:HTH CENPB-type domain-containing protein n=1 Tax=Cordylochernes scorpioides TaxID=51811 RepID=A0ABY6KEQ1_9ARAC|nr:hypothetical protein LAZ67_4003355 [Cordylochernes scorpioides]
MKKEVKREVISLETKIEILDRLRKGDRVVDVAKSYSMNEATIRTIRTNENTIRKSVAAGNTTSMGTTSYTRNIAMEKMEQALMLWIEDQAQKRVPIDTGAITNKALRIYEKIVEQLPSFSSTEKKPNFLASHGWFEIFKIRHSLHRERESLKLKGELASGDVDAVQEYPANFAEIINDNSYTLDQVFNADESSGHKAAKDRITHIAELMADKELSEDDLVNLVCESESDKSDEEELVPVTFTAKVIREGLALGRKLGKLVRPCDSSSVLRILKRDKYRVYIPRLVQQLNDDDPDRRLQFCEWIQEMVIREPGFMGSIIWSDEAQFKLNGTVNRHNCVYWCEENPHITIEKAVNLPGVNVWCGLSSRGLIGPFRFEGTVTGINYLTMLADSIFPAIRALYGNDDFYFQLDGAPPHYHRDARAYLDKKLSGQWIGRRGPIEFPARSPDLTPLDFFLWGTVKDGVYKRKPRNLDILWNEIQAVCREISLDVLIRCTESVVTRTQNCIDAAGHQFEQY